MWYYMSDLCSSLPIGSINYSNHLLKTELASLAMSSVNALLVALYYQYFKHIISQKASSTLIDFLGSHKYRRCPVIHKTFLAIPMGKVVLIIFLFQIDLTLFYIHSKRGSYAGKSLVLKMAT